jgi:tRNA G10  N-methylase Trm11
LTFYEASAVVGEQVERLGTQAVQFAADSDESARTLFGLLGAAVRVIKIERDWQKYTTSKLGAILVELLTEQVKDNKLQFAIANWGQQADDEISLSELKKALLKKNIKVRFIEGARQGLSAAVLLHQPVTELVVWQNEGQTLIGRTLGVQDIDYWTTKDRGKPYADRKKGMLPPKIARAMVNLALGTSTRPVVYDPFCGTGTILLEALERGCLVVGSDADGKAAQGTKDNLRWFADLADLPTDFKVFTSQAAHVTPAQVGQPISAIVTEPFLGKPQTSTEKLAGSFKGLEKLYLGAFKQWRALLQDQALVVMIFPRVELADGRLFELSDFVDKLQPYGYTRRVDFGQIRYFRPQAQIQRDIIVFEFKK